MKSKKKFWWIIIISVLLSLAIGVFVGSFISGKSIGRNLFPFGNNKINVILDIINEDYVDGINMKDFTEEAIVNIISGLDPHSVYIPSKDLQFINEGMDGHFGGIGADFFLHLDTIVIVSVTHGSPSEQAGLLRGDRIVTINDTSYIGSSTITEEKVLNMVRGEVGTSIKLGIRRDSSDKILPFEIKRGEIPLTTVRAAYLAAEDIGLIKIYDKFSHTTYNEFIKAMAKLMSLGCKAFIIDLRMNGGGTLDAAINIANEFLPMGSMIVYTEGKSFPREEARANGTGTCQDSPIVILTDQMSASASEIVAGAIQDNDRGLIIGRRSFGKGLVQNQITLSDGSALRLTIARYFTPSGRNIQRQYELGKANEYNQVWIDQLTNGEGFHEDSIKLDKTLEYKTAYDRSVYGGGGIMPDLFVPIDTVNITTYYRRLENKGIFNQFAFNYSDNNRAELNKFNDYLEMLEYLKSQPLLNEIVRYAEEKGIKRRSNLITRSADHILTTTYAFILRNFFGDEAFYPVYMSNDPDVKKAIEIIQQGEANISAIRQIARTQESLEP